MAEEATRNLRSATTGFDALFSNDLEKANEIFGGNQSPFHALGAGVCAFLEAALGMEVCIIALLIRYHISNGVCVGRADGERYEAAVGCR